MRLMPALLREVAMVRALRETLSSPPRAEAWAVMVAGKPSWARRRVHVASFLVDTDEEFVVGIFLQVGAELFDLLGRLDVAVAGAGGSIVLEEDDASDVVVAYVAHDGAFVVDGGAAEPYEEHLADVLQQLVALIGVGFRLGRLVLAAGRR